MRTNVEQVIEKLKALPPERIAEVEDFVDFLRQRSDDRQLIQSAMQMAEPSLQKIWDNLDDATYDVL